MKQTSKYIQKALNTEKSLRIADNVPVQNHTKSSVKMKIETTKIGCWNVKSTGNPTKFSIKLINVIATMREKNLSLLAMGTLEIEGTTVLYSGLSEPKNGNQRGVAIALRDDLKKAWKKEGTHSMISERVIKARIKVEDKHINFIAVYAPTEVDNEEESENFYETLQDQLARISKKKHVIVLGDFNVRVGPLENPSRLHGRHNSDKRNVNGTRLVDFCNTNGLIITNTIFPHKRIHQWTWYHPNKKKDMSLIMCSSVISYGQTIVIPRSLEKQFIFQIIIWLYPN